jgi:hypothetical protein
MVIAAKAAQASANSWKDKWEMELYKQDWIGYKIFNEKNRVFNIQYWAGHYTS